MKCRRGSEKLKTSKLIMLRSRTMLYGPQELDYHQLISIVHEIVLEMVAKTQQLIDQKQQAEMFCGKLLSQFSMELGMMMPQFELHSFQQVLSKTQQEPKSIAADQTHYIVPENQQTISKFKKNNIRFSKGQSQSCEHYFEETMILKLQKGRQEQRVCKKSKLIALKTSRDEDTDEKQKDEVQQWLKRKKQLKLDLKKIHFRQITLNSTQSHQLDLKTPKTYRFLEEPKEQINIYKDTQRTRRKINLVQTCNVRCLPEQMISLPGTLKKKTIMDLQQSRRGRKRKVLGDTCAFIQQAHENDLLLQDIYENLEQRVKIERGVKLIPLTSLKGSKKRLETVR